MLCVYVMGVYITQYFIVSPSKRCLSLSLSITVSPENVWRDQIVN